MESDCIIVVGKDKDGHPYIGSSTRREIRSEVL